MRCLIYIVHLDGNQCRGLLETYGRDDCEELLKNRFGTHEQEKNKEGVWVDKQRHEFKWFKLKKLLIYEKKFQYVEKGFSYNSLENDNYLSIDELRNLIKKNIDSSFVPY